MYVPRESSPSLKGFLVKNYKSIKRYVTMHGYDFFSIYYKYILFYYLGWTSSTEIDKLTKEGIGEGYC